MDVQVLDFEQPGTVRCGDSRSAHCSGLIHVLKAAPVVVG
jgi:hypothetical protein